MTETGHDTERLSDFTFSEMGPAAVEHMVGQGFSLVRGSASPHMAEDIVSHLDESRFFNQVGKGRKGYAFDSSSDIPAIAHVAKFEFAGSFARQTDKYPEFGPWLPQPAAGVDRLRIDLVRYEDGVDLERHADDEGKFPTQVIWTLRGSAKMDIYADDTSRRPTWTLDLQTGDKVLLRGDEFPGGQLPHAVRDNQGGRIIASVYPDRSAHDTIRLRARLGYYDTRN